MSATRAAIDLAIGEVVRNASNFPDKVQARLLGQDMAPLRKRLTDAVVGALSTPIADDVREALTSVEELEALPTRSVVMDGSGEVWRKTVTGLWDCLDGQGDQPVEESATVLWQSAPPRVTVLWASGEVRPRGTATDAYEAAPALADDCDCEDREALVRPEGLVCGTCGKVIDPSSEFCS